MQCKRHKREVVAMCSECNAGVCEICADATSGLRENYGTLCIPCYVSKVNESIEWYRQKRGKALKNIIISCILYFFGAMMIIMGLADKTYPMAFVGVFFCGFYSAISGWKKAEAAHDEYERKHGASYTITDDGVYRDTGLFGKILTTAIFTVFGVIVTPIRVIANFISRSKDKKTIDELNEEIERVKKI